MSEPTNNSSVELNTPKVGPSAPIEGPDALTASEQKHRPGRNERDGKHMSRGHLIPASLLASSRLESGCYRLGAGRLACRHWPLHC